jgi:hypothetical protein
MRFARGDMRDHIVSHKNDYGAPYRRYGVLQRRSQLKINFCEIFGVGRFSIFATISAKSGLKLLPSCAKIPVSLILRTDKSAGRRHYRLDLSAKPAAIDAPVNHVVCRLASVKRRSSPICDHRRVEHWL